jgi:hypothetical protein
MVMDGGHVNYFPENIVTAEEIEQALSAHPHRHLYRHPYGVLRFFEEIMLPQFGLDPEKYEGVPLPHLRALRIQRRGC